MATNNKKVGSKININVITLIIIIIIALVQYNQNQRTDEKLDELTGAVTSLKESEPDIRFLKLYKVPTTKNSFEFWCKDKNNNCSYNPLIYLWDNLNYTEYIIFISNQGKKTKELRVRMDCKEGNYYAIRYPLEFEIEVITSNVITFKIPEIDQVNPTIISLLLKTNETIFCKIDYSSNDIDKGSAIIEIP